MGTQDELAIAEGGPGFLVVWADERTVLSGTTNAPGDSLAGNMQDIYGQILDHTGAPIGPPLVISNLGRNQRDPEVAWNGENWLVAFETEDPAWYFEGQVYAVRVSPEGEVLDDEPIVIFTQEEGQSAYDPDVASDGTNWLVVGDQWIDSQRTIRGRRVAPDGTVLDAQPVNLLQSGSLQNPVVEFTAGVYLLAANSLFADQLYIRTYGTDLASLTNLQAIGPATPYRRPGLASNGSQFMVVGDRAHRIQPDGTNLDPGGIALGGSEGAEWFDVAWTGTRWAVSMRTLGFEYHVLGQRIAPDGTVLDAQPVLIEEAPSGVDNFEAPTGIEGAGNGDAVVAFVRRDPPMHHADVRSALFGAGGSVSPAEDVSIGLPRQSYVRFAEGDGMALAVYVSEASGRTRLLSQRLTLDGTVIDAEPTEIYADEREGVASLYVPHVEWNGEVFLVAWQSPSGGAVGVRVSSDNTVLDPVPLLLTPPAPPGESYTIGAVAAAGDVFVVGVFHGIAFHEPVRYVEYLRVAPDGSVLDPFPIRVAEGFSREMTGRAFAGSGFLAWAQYNRHDSTRSHIEGVLVNANGTASSRLEIGDTGMEPDIGSADDVALVVWQDDSIIHEDDVKGRLVAPGGAFLGDEFVISGAANEQMRPAAAFDGDKFIVAWTDYRSLTIDVEQLRGDIFLARVARDGTVLDPSGVEVTQGPPPENLPDVAAGEGRAVVAFSILHGLETPEIQRIGYRTLGGSALVLSQTPLRRGQDATFVVRNAQAGERAYYLYSLAGTGPGPCPPMLGGMCVDLLNPIRMFGSAVADASGVAMLVQTIPANAPLTDVHTQAVVRRGTAGADSVKSNTVSDTIRP